MGIIFTGSRHSIRPSLNLDFANSKALDPRITFTRASNATYYDGYTSVKAEENLYSYSQEFDNAFWTKFNTTASADDIVAPDGTTTAERITVTATAGAYINRGSIMQSGEEYTLSIYAKAGTADNIRITNITSGTTGAWFDLSTGTIGTQNGASNSSTITDVGNGWYRITRTFGSVTANSSTESLFGINDGDGLTTAPSNGYLYVWGAQIEKRSSATAYTPTTSSPITKYQPALQTAGNNVARFDHNPTTGESLGLLIEESRSNLQVYSEEFDNAAWSKGASTITPNTIIAPDGTLTADKLVEDNTTSTHSVSDVFSFTSGTSYTVSIYAKAAERDYLLFQPSNNTEFPLQASFNLSNGTVASVITELGTPSITDVGNGWYRCSITGTTTATSSRTLRFLIGNGSFTYTGDGYSGIYIWGAQIEAGTFPTSYIKTTGSQVTRSADDAVMTGTNFTDWFNNQEGTLYVNCNINTLSEDNVGAVSLGDSANRIELRGTGSSTNTPRFDSIYNGTAQMAIQIPSLGSETNRRLALSYNMNDYNISTSANGNSVNKDISGNIPIIDSNDGLKIGKNAYTSSLQQLGGTIKKVSYYPIALTDNEIVDLTEA